MREQGKQNNAQTNEYKSTSMMHFSNLYTIFELIPINTYKMPIAVF